MSTLPAPASPTSASTIERKWYTVAEVALMLGYGPSKTKMLVAQRRIVSIKDGRNRRILGRWVDDYVNRLATAAEAEMRP
ncbi:helix-turn-helix domain-containing protein [Embleya sp. NPDC059259]|uniref:helix-turn-helix domain-containing protein n=1 Tax=unclassified Embleya TaxID=2699296 RepID=UPI003683F841